MPVEVRCAWCLRSGHETARCPGIDPYGFRALAAWPPAVPDADDLLADRLLAWRVFALELWREMIAAGGTPSLATLHLCPDPAVAIDHLTPAPLED